ncbi:hypothetical protein QYF36_004904 [Acer negundo]|nr:hypothetical protein QYF36_004904 [Acer negundo]
MIKAEKLKSILVARIHLWLVRVISMLMLWAIALQLRALGNTLAPTPNFQALPPPIKITSSFNPQKPETFSPECCKEEKRSSTPPIGKEARSN